MKGAKPLAHPAANTPMFAYSQTPRALLRAMGESLSLIRDPRARHWLVLPKRGRAEYVTQQWANRAGIASHAQEVTLRELIEQAASGPEPRFDFEQLKLAIASSLHSLREHPASPIPKHVPLNPISAAVLDWSASLARALDETMLCRHVSERWDEGSFLGALAAHPTVEHTLRTHIGSLNADTFDKHARRWISYWAARGGIPHLWIQLDAGLPMIELERLDQFLCLLSKTDPSRVHLFAISPSVEYWGESQLRRRKRRSGDCEESDPEHHPGGVLWAFGRCSQDLHRQLSDSLFALGDGGTLVDDSETPDSLLGALQRSCRNAAPPSTSELYKLLPNEASLTVHSTRSTLRELETCRDRILQAMHELPDLRYEEILILLADPKRQAPFIDAALRVNDSAHSALPFRLLGFGQAVPSPFAETLTTLLRKIRGRLNLEDLQLLIENPLIASRFGFDDAGEAGRTLVEWLRDTQFRWGTSAEHRIDHQQIEEIRWNLSWAIQRLGLGALSASNDASGILQPPNWNHAMVPIERATGLSLTALAQLATFAASLERARKVWNQTGPQPLANWNAALKTLINDFLDCTEPLPAQHLSKLANTIIPSLSRASAGLECNLSADGYLRILFEKLESIAESGARGPGGIRVADLREYAGVPARMILIAGLNADTFPRGEERPAWHPLSASRKNGDPSLRDADRHAILLSLIACEERLVLSYQGGSDEDGKDRPPSTALADLLQAVDSIIADSAEGSHEPKHALILFRHPLNGFSPAAFNSNQPSSARGYLRSDFDAAMTLHCKQGLLALEGIWSQPLPHKPVEHGARISTRTIQTLLSKPGKLLLKRIGAELPEAEETLASGDLLDLDGLEKWTIRDTLLSAKLEGSDVDELRRILSASGAVPRGTLGDAVVTGILQEAPDAPQPALKRDQRITRTLRITLKHPADANRHCTLEGELRHGWYRDQTSDPNRFLFYSASKRNLGKELQFLADALILAAASDACGAQAHAHFQDGAPYSITLPSMDRAHELLGVLLPLLEAAQSTALPFWPKSMEAMSKKFTFSADASAAEISQALEIGRESWGSDGFGSGSPESESLETRYIFRGCDDPFGLQTDTESTDFLPSRGAPLAWRLAIFLHRWKATVEKAH
jgi:exodeoxyribonuclease V gamma subunit